jgi:hypothetical protein
MKQLLTFFAILIISILSPALHAQFVAAKYTQNNANSLLNIAEAEDFSPSSSVNTISAALENKKINLDWSIAMNAAPKSFIIERSFDGEHFEVVGSGPAVKSDNSKKSFSFTDNPGNKALQHRDIFYRIGTLTMNNSYQYTKPLMVRVRHKGPVEYITVYPHPADNEINMLVGLKENAYLVARITDEQGLEILKQHQKITVSQQQISLAGTSKLNAGIYWLEVMVDSKETLKMKLIKD